MDQLLCLLFIIVIVQAGGIVTGLSDMLYTWRMFVLSCNLTHMLQEVVRTVLTAQECAVHARLLSRNGLLMEVLARSFYMAGVVGMGTSLTVCPSVKLCVKEGEEAKVEPGETKEF